MDVTVKFGRLTCRLEIRFKSLSDITGNHTLVSILVSVLETQVSQLYLSALSLPAQITFYLLPHNSKTIEQNMLNTGDGSEGKFTMHIFWAHYNQLQKHSSN